jgi:hypothetical protein
VSDSPDPRPGERRLARPPSERYRPPQDRSPASTTPRPTSPARALALGTLAALAGTGATILLGGPLTVSAGLLVIAAVTGWLVGTAVRVGGGATIRTPSRRLTAAALAIAGVVLGQVGLWLYAQAEGGVLPLVDHLVQTYGLLVVGQLVIAGVVAWWTAR